MRKFTILSALLLLFSVAVSAQVNPQAPLELDPAVRTGKLENGLTYYIRHNDKPENAADFYICTNVGAIQENEKQDGLAHFLEHMAFNGIKSLPGKQMFTYLEGIGAKMGENINAATGVEFTRYMLNNIPLVREGVLDTCLMILHDWSCAIENLDSEIDNERPVIIEELRGGRNASRRMWEESAKYIYGDSKYATTNIIGTIEGLETFDPQSLRDFYRTWYRPDLQAIIVVGDVDVDAVEAKIKAKFSDISMPENPEPKVLHRLPYNETPVVGIITDPEATSTILKMYSRMEPLPDELNATGVAVLQSMMQYVVTSVLNERFGEIGQTPDSPFLGAGSSYGALTVTSDVFVNAVVAKDGELMKGYRALLTELERVKRYGITPDEFERAKTRYIRAFEVAVERAGSRSNADLVEEYIAHFLNNEPYMEPEYALEQVKTYFQFMTAEQVNMALKELISDRNMVIVVEMPEKEGLAVPDEKEILEALAQVKTEEISAPEIKVAETSLLDESSIKAGKIKKEKDGKFDTHIWTLSNGVTVYFRQSDFSKGRISASLTNDGGRSLFGDEDMLVLSPEISSAYMSYAGLGNMSASDLAKALTGRSVYASHNIGDYYHGIQFGGSVKDLETMFQIAYMSYTAQRFDKETFDMSMKQLKESLSYSEQQPSFALNTALNDVLYDSPRRFVLTDDMIDEVSFDRYRTVMTQLFSNVRDGRLFIIGDVDPDVLKPMVEKYIASLPSFRKGTRMIDRGTGIVKESKVLDFRTRMEMPKTTSFQVYTADMKYSARNLMLADALAYAMNLCYTRTVREEAGGTYGVSSSVTLNNVMQDRLVAIIMFDTQDEKADALIELTRDGLVGISENGVSEEDLNKIKENFRKTFQEQQKDNGYWAQVITSYYYDNVDVYDGYLEMVDSLTSDDIRDFAAEIIRQNCWINVVMRPQAE